jgi:hypothetical protein
MMMMYYITRVPTAILGNKNFKRSHERIKPGLYSIPSETRSKRRQAGEYVKNYFFQNTVCPV